MNTADFMFIILNQNNFSDMIMRHIGLYLEDGGSVLIIYGAADINSSLESRVADRLKLQSESGVVSSRRDALQPDAELRGVGVMKETRPRLLPTRRLKH